MQAAISQLTRGERMDFFRLETVIKSGLNSFREVGEALNEIHTRRLYRETHSTFEGYCQEKWKFTERRARQLIEAWKVGTIVPIENEGQARVLSGHSPEMQQAAFEQATAGGAVPTAKTLSEILDQIQADEGEDDAPAAPRKKASTNTADIDGRLRRYGVVLANLYDQLDSAASGLSPKQLTWLEENPFASAG